MALQRRKILAQALNLGFGTDTIPADSGGLLVGDKIGLHTFLPNFINVDSFGAVGDGVTDDTAAIQAAINEGWLITASPGKTYKTTATISLPFNHQIIQFNGATVKPVGIFDAFSLSEDEIQVFNMRVDASGLTGSVFSNTTAIELLWFENILVGDSGSAAVFNFKDIFLSWFRGLRVRQHGGTAFHAYSSISGSPINGVWIEDCDFSGGTNGAADSVLIEGAVSVSINDCSFYNNASGGNDIRLRSNNFGPINGVAIEGCIFRDAINQAGNCIYIGDPSVGTVNHENIFITDCYFESSKQNIRLGAHVVGETVCAIDTVFVFTNGSPTQVVERASGVAYPRMIRALGSWGADQNHQEITIQGQTPFFTPTGVAKVRVGGVPDSGISGFQEIVLEADQAIAGQLNEQIALIQDTGSGAGLGCRYGTNIAHPILWSHDGDATVLELWRKPTNGPVAGGTQVLSVSSGGQIQALGGFMIGTSSGPTHTAGVGVPVTTPANGSTYSRSDGGAGSTFYVYAGGVWTAIA